MSFLDSIGAAMSLRFDGQPAAPNDFASILAQAQASLASTPTSLSGGTGQRSTALSAAPTNQYTQEYWTNMVRMGMDKRQNQYMKDGSPKGSFVTKPGIWTVEAANNAPYTWSATTLEKNMKRMSDATGIQIKTFSDAVQIWQSAVDRARLIAYSTSGKRQLTPWDVFDLTKKETLKAGILYGNGTPKEGSMGYTKFTQTDRQIQDVTPGDAYAVLKRAATEALGRAPTADELRAFTSVANHEAAQNPTVTKTTSTIDNALGKTKSSSSHTKGGFNANDLMALGDKKTNTPEAGAYEAATTYYNALISALGSVTG